MTSGPESSLGREARHSAPAAHNLCEQKQPSGCSPWVRTWPSVPVAALGPQAEQRAEQCQMPGPQKQGAHMCICPNLRVTVTWDEVENLPIAHLSERVPPFPSPGKQVEHAVPVPAISSRSKDSVRTTSWRKSSWIARTLRES